MIRVVTWITNPLLRDLIRTQLENTPDFELAGEADDPIDLFALVAETNAKVVFCSWKSGEHIPDVCLQLLEEFPDLFVAGAPTDEDAVVLYWQEIRCRRIPSAGIDTLVSEIRDGCRNETRDDTLSRVAVTSFPGPGTFPFSAN